MRAEDNDFIFNKFLRHVGCFNQPYILLENPNFKVNFGIAWYV